MNLEIILTAGAEIGKAKLSTILPLLQIVAAQNRLNLSKLSQFKKVKRILEISTVNN